MEIDIKAIFKTRKRAKLPAMASHDKTTSPISIPELTLLASELRVSDANEATTRLRLIDKIIFDLLGWNAIDVTTEERTSEDGKTGYIDYLIRYGNESILIEAKKLGYTFSNLPNSRKALLQGNWVRQRKTRDAIVQARDYARQKGVGFCAVTNGLTWIIFPVNRRDTVSFEESLAIIFPDLAFSDPHEVNEFFGVLGRTSVIDGTLEEEILGSDRDQTESRRLNSIYDRSFSKVRRTSIFPFIEREIVTAFSEDLLDANPDLLEKCYVQTAERTRFDSRIQMHLTPRDQVLKTRPIRPVAKKKDQKSVADLISKTPLQSKPIALLTLGLVGSGKSTFLRYTSEISNSEFLKISEKQPDGCWIRIDFRDFGASGDPRRFIFEEIFAYIKSHPFLNNFENSLQYVYKNEIESLKDGPLSLIADTGEDFKKSVAQVILNDYNDVAPYCEKILSYWSRSIAIFIVIDNVDQIEDSEKQAQIFLDATAIARGVSSSLVLAMRDATYVKNRSGTVFDAFDFDAVYIDPPDIKAVLSKRFTVANNLLSNQKIEFKGENGAKVQVDDATLIIDMLTSSVLGTEVGRIIEIAATGDTRLALQMTRQFLQHGYSSTNKAVEVYQRKGRYQLPPHEALRAIMLGNQGVYRESFSVIGNPFDSHLSRSNVQFLRLFILNALTSMSATKDFEGLAAHEIADTLESMGISKRDTYTTLEDMISYRFVFTRSHRNFSEDSIIIASRLGGYVTRELLSKMMFLETTMFDTFIYEKSTWDYISGNMRSIYRERDFLKRFRRRKEVVEAFFDFCSEGVGSLVKIAQQRALPPHWCSNPMEKVRPDFQSEIQRATRSAKAGKKRQEEEENLFTRRAR